MVTLTLRSPANLETCPIWDVAVHGKTLKVHVEYHGNIGRTWVPGKGYVGVPVPPTFAVVDNRRRKGGGTSFSFVEGPNALTDAALTLLHILA
mgnify:CR=1 FL=1